MTAGSLRTLPSHPHRTHGGLKGDDDGDESSTVSRTALPVKDVIVEDDGSRSFARPPRTRVVRFQDEDHRPREDVRVHRFDRVPVERHADVWYGRAHLARLRYETQQLATVIARDAHVYGSFPDALHRVFHGFRCGDVTTTTHLTASHVVVSCCDDDEDEDDLSFWGLESMAVPAIQRDYHVRRRYLMEQVRCIQRQQQQLQQRSHAASVLLAEASHMASHASVLFARYVAQRRRGPTLQEDDTEDEDDVIMTKGFC